MNVMAKKSTRKTRETLPEDQPLPGTEQARDTILDRLCHGIAEIRTARNLGISEEKQIDHRALEHMQKRGITAYHAYGVELARVTGSETLRVRLTRGTSTATAEPVADEDNGE